MIGFLASNWLWLVLIAVFVGMHRSGHGCGMHSGHQHAGEQRNGRTNDHEHGATAEPIPGTGKEKHSGI